MLKQEDPDLLARMIVYAREAGCLRLLPTMATVILSTAGRPDLFEAVFARVVRTPRELRNFLVLSKRTPLRKGLGRCIKRAVGRYLRGLSDYHLLKYGSSDSPFSLRDAVRLVRPRPRDARESLVLRMLTHGRGSISPDALECHFPQAHAFVGLQHATTPKEAIRCITEGRLPPEVVVGALKPDVDTWRALDPTGPESQGRRRPLSGRALPPPLWYPTSGEPPSDESIMRTLSRLRWALEKAVDLSLDNLALPTGKVCLALDVSCSMESPLARGSSVRLVDLGALMACALHRRAPDCTLLLPFDDRVVPYVHEPESGSLAAVAALASVGGGGTALSAPISTLLQRRLPVDWLIAITDCEEWADDDMGNLGFLPTWRAYRRKVAPTAQACLLTLAPYPDRPTPPSEPGVHYFFGWSEAVLAHLSLVTSGGGQLEQVRSWPLAMDLDGRPPRRYDEEVETT